MADFLRDAGCDVTIAFYATRQHRPELCSSTLNSWFGARPKTRSETAFGGHRCIAVGCLDPYLEYNYSRPSELWRKLIDEHDVHIAIGGTTVIATPLVDAGVPHLVWCASDVEGDRTDRRKFMPFWRRFVDRVFITPRLLSQQLKVLSGPGRIMGVSPFTVRQLTQASGRTEDGFGVLPIPVDTEFFSPGHQSLGSIAIGFAGRLDDPRKNPRLLFETLAILRSRGIDASLRVTGENSPSLDRMAREIGISDLVEFVGVLERNSLREFYRSLRVFIIPSFQEGLAIVGLESMACGIPVVSTRCGGPEAYVLDGENGFLSGFDSETMGAHVCRLLEDEALREKFSVAAREWVVENYSDAVFAEKFRVIEPSVGWRRPAIQSLNES